MQNTQNKLLLEAVNRLGTPLYVYDQAAIEKNYKTIKSSFNESVDVYYSIKANPNLAVSATLMQQGAGAEVCSGAEFELALQAGFRPDNIIFVGPAKSRVDLLRAIRLNIRAIVCESKEEFALIDELARAEGRIAAVAVRINPVFIVKNASLKMGGVSSQFGIDQEEFLTDKAFFLEKQNIKLIGIHVFNGTRILDVDVFVENTLNILSLAEQVQREWSLSFTLLDIGGGIGVPYFDKEHAFDFAKMATLLNPHLLRYRTKNKNTRIVLESGRYLVASAGVFVTRIQYIKKSRDTTYLITDGGMNCHLTAAGYGSVLKQNFPVSLLAKEVSSQLMKYHITGPLCTPTDVLGRHVELPVAKVGDYVVIHSSGAYGPSASPTQFLGHGYPAEALIQSDGIKRVRKRDSVTDILRNQEYRATPTFVRMNDTQIRVFQKPRAHEQNDRVILSRKRVAASP